MTHRPLFTFIFAILTAFVLCPRPAAACGGFFCSITPVDQSGEKILFVVDEVGVEVHVQISYQGNDADFSWVVPTRQVPTLSVGIQETFNQLAQRTAPRFTYNYHEEGMCTGYPFGRGTEGYSGAAGGLPPAAPQDGHVDVVSQEVVGPYDSVVLRSDDPEALKNWLRDNHYNLTPAGSALIDPYVREQNYFVALKLHAGATAKDIQPIVLRFAGGEPCIPIRLTAVAAINDMEVTAFLLAQHRAVPTNFYEVKLNLARVDWLNDGSNYKDVVSAAANEASGNAFVTEYAGTSSMLKGALYTPGRYNLGRLRTITDPAAFVNELLSQGFPRDAQMQNLLRKWIPMPDALRAQGVTEQQFYNCLTCYRSALGGFAFDPQGFTNDLDVLVIQPLMHAQQLFDGFPYLTRLYTRISASEMTRDPTFAFNADVPDVSNVHTAELYLECGVGGSWGHSPIRLELPDGREVILQPDGNGGYDRSALDKMPAAASWLALGPTGPGTVVGDNLGQIDAWLHGHNGEAAGGCDAAPAARVVGTSLAGLLIGFAILLGARTRRRRR